MSKMGIAIKRFFRWGCASMVLVAGLSVTGSVSAQGSRIVEPQPPVGIPFGQPVPSGAPLSYRNSPMAIGPAPHATPYPAPYSVSAIYPYATGPGFAVPTYPGYVVNPYPAPARVRQVTPVEGPYDAYSVPRVIEPVPSTGSQIIPLSQSEFASSTTLASIGNLRVSIGERFLNRFIAREETRPGEVNDVILGADVRGHQTTSTRLRFDLLPSLDKMRGVFILTGINYSQTTGYTSQAMVDVASEQQFYATKDLFFDGFNFSTRHAKLHVQNRNQTLGAQTQLSGTLFGGIADRIAYSVAERQRPEAEAIARDRLAERVYPEFDNEVDRNLADANIQLESTVRRKLREFNLMPTRQQVSSTDTRLNYCLQIGNEAPMTSPSLLENDANVDDGVNVLVHESLLNTLLAGSGLKGFKTTDRKIREFFAPYEVKSSTGDSNDSPDLPALPGMENLTTDIEFDEVDPATIRFENGKTVLILRAHFKPMGQTLLPPLEVSVDYDNQLVGDKIVVIPSNVRVELQNKDDADSAPPMALKLVARGIEMSFTKLAIDRSMPPSLWKYNGIVPRVNSMRIKDGWTSILVN